MVQTVSDFLAWLAHLANKHRRSVVAFRESTPAHFLSPDGSFEAWKKRANSKIYPTPDPPPGYQCHPNNGTALENNIAARLLANWAQPPTLNPNPLSAPTPIPTRTTPTPNRVHTLAVNAYLRPYHKMKYGHCANDGRMKVRGYILWSAIGGLRAGLTIFLP